MNSIIIYFFKKKDSILFLDYGGKVPSEDMFDIFIQYNADENRTCQASLISNDLIYAFSKSQILLNAGKNQSKAITLTNANTTPVGSGYTLLIQFFDTKTPNNSLTYTFSKSVQVSQGKQGFYSSNGKIYDGNKNEFLMRGINNGHIWADGWNRWWSYNSLPQIKQLGAANTVRICWASNSARYSLNTPNDLDKILNSTIANRMVRISKFATQSTFGIDLY